MTIRELAQMDCREAFDTLEEATYFIQQDENSFMACYLDGMAGDDELGEDDEFWGSDSLGS